MSIIVVFNSGAELLFFVSRSLNFTLPETFVFSSIFFSVPVWADWIVNLKKFSIFQKKALKSAIVNNNYKFSLLLQILIRSATLSSLDKRFSSANFSTAFSV